MVIITNDPFDSIGFGIERLKRLGLTCENLMSDPLREALPKLDRIIIVHTRGGKPVTTGVFYPDACADMAIQQVVSGTVAPHILNHR